MKHIKLDNTSNIGVASFGQFGLRVLTSAAIEGENFNAIQVIEDCVISTKLRELDGKIGDTDIASLALTAGTVIYGRFYDLDVESGKVIAYKG